MSKFQLIKKLFKKRWNRDRIADLPKKYKQKIQKANQDILLTWANRLLTAQTLEEIFN